MKIKRARPIEKDNEKDDSDQSSLSSSKKLDQKPEPTPEREKKTSKNTLYLAIIVVFIVLASVFYYFGFSKGLQQPYQQPFQQPSGTSGTTPTTSGQGTATSVGGFCNKDSDCFVAYCKGQAKDCINATKMATYANDNCNTYSDFFVENKQDASTCGCVQNACTMK
jgi:hypothetical protein